jgi:hypothetical protein
MSDVWNLTPWRIGATPTSKNWPRDAKSIRLSRPVPRLPSRAKNQSLRCTVNRLIAVIPAAIVLIVAVSMGIGAALLGYPVWAIPLIAVFGAGGAIVAVRMFG